MNLVMLKTTSMHVRPCTRCISTLIVGAKPSSSAGHLRLRWLHSLRLGATPRNVINCSKVGGKKSHPSSQHKYYHTHLLPLTATRDLHVSRDVSLEQSVKFSRQGCPVFDQQIRSHTSSAPAGKQTREHTQDATKKDTSDRGWVLPQGMDTGITVYNSVTRKKEKLILPKGRIATWYACGPTVYDHAHIGHASSYVRTDIIRRILINHFNIDVVLVLGVTDIDDKIIKRTKETGMNYRHLTRAFEDEFFKDMEALNIMPPNVKTRVTEHIPQIIYFISRLIDTGFAYKTPGGTVYFDVTQYGRYGRLWTHRLDTQIRDAIDKDKKGPRDFALWKAAKPDEPSWDSPWGKGRPGWHIECSTMASSIFGEKLDIHSGGDDLRFPHHENEMAQSEACFCTNQWTNYWMHTGHLHLKSDKNKMSKSLNNTVRVSELLRDNTASQFRVFCMLRPYRQQIEYSTESMQKAVRIHEAFFSFMSLAEAYIKGQVHCQAINEPLLMEALVDTRSRVDRALADDFDTPKAVHAIEELIRKTNIELGGKAGPEEPFVSRSPGTVASVLSYVERMLNVWGVEPPTKKLTGNSDTTMRLGNVLDSVIQFRSKIREYALHPQEHLSQEDLESCAGEGEKTLSAKEKKKLEFRKVKPLLEACDNLRDDLKLTGVTIQDHGKTARWVLEDKKLPSNKGN